MEPVKTHFAEIGLPASFRIADDAELLPLSERVMEELIDEFYVKYASNASKTASINTFSLLHDNPFAALCDSMTPSKNDRDLIPTLQELYNRLLSFPEELERLKTESIRLAEQANGDFLNSDHGKQLHEWIKVFCASALPFQGRSQFPKEARQVFLHSQPDRFFLHRFLRTLHNSLQNQSPKKELPHSFLPTVRDKRFRFHTSN
jgi:hypothetical protein